MGKLGAYLAVAVVLAGCGDGGDGSTDAARTDIAVRPEVAAERADTGAPDAIADAAAAEPAADAKDAPDAATAPDSGGTPDAASPDVVLGPLMVDLPGVVQKGPFARGSTVTIQELDRDLTPTGRSYTLQTEDDSGAFRITRRLETRYLEISANGFFFDEVWGRLTSERISLTAVIDGANATNANANILTHLARPRIVALVRGGLPFAQAKSKAEAEVLKAVHAEGVTVSGFEALDITGTSDGAALLLALSARFIISCDRWGTEGSQLAGRLTDLLASAAATIARSGTIEDPVPKTAVDCAGPEVPAAAVRQNLTQRYALVGKTVTLPAFEKYLTCHGPGQVTRTAALPNTVLRALGLPTGKVLLSLRGGQVVTYDPATGATSGVPAVSGDSGLGTDLAMSGVLADGRVLFLGRPSRVFDPQGGGVTTVANVPFVPRFIENTPIVLPDGRLLIADTDGALFTFDATAGTFSPLPAPPFPVNRYNLLRTGRVLLTGQRAVAAALLDPEKGTYADTGPMVAARGGRYDTAVLADGRVLVVGDESQGGVPPVMTTELYDPATGKFTAGPPLPVLDAPPFFRARLIPVGDGDFLTTLDETRALFLYRGATNDFVCVHPRLLGGIVATAALKNRRVFFAGGWDSALSDEAARTGYIVDLAR